MAKSAGEECQDLQTLAQARDLVRLSTRTALGRQVERHLRRTRIEAKSRLEFDDPEAVMATVGNNLGWSILTPLSSMLGRASWPKLKFLPLPGPGASREIYVIAREKELGEIPRRIAEAAIESLNEAFNAAIAPCCPWMTSLYSLPGMTADEPTIADVPPSASSSPRWPLRDLAPLDKLAHNS